MNIIKKMNIKSKLGILFIILCISIFILAYKLISISENNKNTLKGVRTKSQTALSLQTNIITPLHSLRQLNQSLVMAPNNEIRNGIQKDIEKHIIKLDKGFESLHENPIYKDIWQNYKMHINQTKNYLQEDFEEGAYINVTTVSKKQFDILVKELIELQKQYLNNATLAYEQASTRTIEIKVEIIVIIIMILIFAIAIGWFVTNNILQSIYKVQNGLNDFFKYLNDKKTKINKIEIDGKDEFKQMAIIINKNVAYIRTIIEQNEACIINATKVLENIERGQLGARLSKSTKDQSLNELKNMINNMIDNLEEKIQKEIDKRLKQEQLLIQQSKLAAMGEMIGNIAHQWRQPLAQISAIHMNMKVTYDFGKFSKKYMDEKMDEAKKLTSYMSQTISDFQNFFKPQGNKELFSIEKACKEAYFIVESSLNFHGIKVNFDIKEDVEIMGYKNEFSQVFLNLISNAKDIILERKIKNPQIDIEIKSGEKFAIVKVQDNAGGVRKEIIDKIFDPYFTTRHKTQGTGIGLYMAKNIIERNMCGYINVRNNKGGALFTAKVSKK